MVATGRLWVVGCMCMWAGVYEDWVVGCVGVEAGVRVGGCVEDGMHVRWCV